MPLAFDTETTGLCKPDACDPFYQPFLTEIYICDFDYDGTIKSEFETFVNPPMPIPEIVTKLTGIDNDTVKNAPEFIEIYDDLCDFVRGHKTIFAHNCSFDINVLRFELARHDLEFRFPWPSEQICTVEASFHIKNKRMALGDLYTLATGGKTMKNKHRAKDDVLAMVDCIVWLKENGFFK